MCFDRNRLNISSRAVRLELRNGPPGYVKPLIRRDPYIETAGAPVALATLAPPDDLTGGAHLGRVHGPSAAAPPNQPCPKKASRQHRRYPLALREGLATTRHGWGPMRFPDRHGAGFHSATT